jgi:hypothetical protein
MGYAFKMTHLGSMAFGPPGANRNHLSQVNGLFSVEVLSLGHREDTPH